MRGEMGKPICFKYETTVRVDGIFSLKSKRSLVSRLKGILCNEWKVCVCESHRQDDLRYVGLTIAFLAPSKNQAEETLNRLEVLLEEETNGIIESSELATC